MLTFCRPVNNPNPRITANFSSFHPGKDYAETVGTPVYAKQDGIVRILQQNEQRQWIANTASDPYRKPLYWMNRRSLTNADYGNCVIIHHSEGFQSLDAHLKYGSICVKEGQSVKKGQKIAEVGSTANSTGNHVHDELRLNGNKVDLVFYFDALFTGYFADATELPVVTCEDKLNKIQGITNQDLNESVKIQQIKQIIG